MQVAYVWGWPEPYTCTLLRCIYGTQGREMFVGTVKYGVRIQFWPTLVRDVDV